MFERINLAVTVWEVDENIEFICWRQPFDDLRAFATARESIMGHVDVTAWTETTHFATALSFGHFDLGPARGFHRCARHSCQADSRQCDLSRNDHFGLTVRMPTFALNYESLIRWRSR